MASCRIEVQSEFIRSHGEKIEIEKFNIARLSGHATYMIVRQNEKIAKKLKTKSKERHGSIKKSSLYFFKRNN
ncbi:hypothetical protein DOY81_014878 [Sarcophaga bullata]|nr:hypothetical protein DOY81_014878 [Sarcophaga bullata]